MKPFNYALYIHHRYVSTWAADASAQAFFKLKFAGQYPTVDWVAKFAGSLLDPGDNATSYQTLQNQAGAMIIEGNEPVARRKGFVALGLKAVLRGQVLPSGRVIFPTAEFFNLDAL